MKERDFVCVCVFVCTCSSFEQTNWFSHHLVWKYATGSH